MTSVTTATIRTDHHKEAKAPSDSLSSYTATIINNSRVTLTLTSSASNLQWTSFPPNTIPPGGTGKFSSPGDFSNPAAGSVEYAGGTGGAIGISWNIPSVGPNSIRWTQSDKLTISEDGSTGGWHVQNTFTVAGG